jgi:hypothetical protein
MMSVIMHGVIMLDVILMFVILLSVNLKNVMAPLKVLLVFWQLLWQFN